MACVGQAASQNEQPMQFFSSIRVGLTCSPVVSSNSSTPAGHTSMQAPQATHLDCRITGFNHKDLLTLWQSWPSPLRIDALGHTLPHVPQSIQMVSLIMCCILRSPLMAATGQILRQAVQPVQVSMMVWVTAHLPPSPGCSGQVQQPCQWWGCRSRNPSRFHSSSPF